MPSKVVISSEVIMEFGDLFSSYWGNTSGGKEDILNDTSGTYVSSGAGPDPEPGTPLVAGVVRVAGAKGGSLVQLTSFISSGLSPSSWNYS